MGFNCHVATKYQVEYDYGFFSFQQEILNNLLYRLCPNTLFSEDCVEYSYNLRIPKDELRTAIEVIKGDRDLYEAELKKEEAGFSVNELVSNLETWLEKSDPQNDFIRLSWF